jgi:5-methylcytosine-specific restriction endonuclease McrA
MSGSRKTEKEVAIPQGHPLYAVAIKKIGQIGVSLDMSHYLGQISPVDFIDDNTIRNAIVSYTTWKDVCDVLGLGEGSKPSILERCTQMCLDVSHLPSGRGGWSKGRKKDPLTKPIVEAWKRGEVCGHTGKTMGVKRFVREYMCIKAGHKCQKCSWDKIHPTTGRVPLEVNHIDGDPSNTVESNLEAICPNCHALTPTFKNLNKGRGRSGR